MYVATSGFGWVLVARLVCDGLVNTGGYTHVFLPCSSAPKKTTSNLPKLLPVIFH